MSGGAVHDIAAERAVIGAVLLRPAAAPALVAALPPGDFWLPTHAELWTAIEAMAVAGRPIDAVLLDGELRGRGRAGQTGGLDYLYELAHEVATAENAAHYAARVRSAALARRVYVAAIETAAEAGRFRPGADDAAALAERAAARLAEAGRGDAAAGPRPVREAIAAASAAIERRGRRAQAGVSGLPTGYADVDRLLAGLQPGEVTVLAARPSVGKTALALAIAQHVAVVARRPALLFSVEMSAEAIGERLVSMVARIDGARLRGGYCDRQDWVRITEAAAVLSLAPLWVDDDGAPTARQIVARARAWRADRAVFPPGDDGLGLVVVDYLQLVRPSRTHEHREREVAEASATLKAAAKATRCPWLVLSQLRRIERDAEPRLSDLRESGSIEQDADVVAFLHPGKDDSAVKLMIAKNRNGPTGAVPLVWIAPFTRFESAAREAADREGWGG